MSEIRVGAPHGTDCGDVFEIEERRAVVKWTRKLAGPVTVTSETKYKSQCSQDAVYYRPVGNGTMIAMCRQHMENQR